MDDEKLHEYLAFLDGRSPGSEYLAIAKLEEQGVDIPNLLTKRYKVSRRWSDRALCISHCMKYAKTNELAYRLGILALKDRSRTVQRAACKLLAVTQSKDAIKYLEKLLSDEFLREDAEAAIDALDRMSRK